VVDGTEATGPAGVVDGTTAVPEDDDVLEWSWWDRLSTSTGRRIRATRLAPTHHHCRVLNRFFTGAMTLAAIRLLPSGATRLATAEPNRRESQRCPKCETRVTAAGAVGQTGGS
jgi:hypothetical protein